MKARSSGRSRFRRSMRGLIGSTFFGCVAATGLLFADESLSSSAVGQLQQQPVVTASEPARYELYDQFNARLNTSVEPTLMALGAATGPTPWFMSPWVFLGLGIQMGALGAAVAFYLYRRRKEASGELPSDDASYDGRGPHASHGRNDHAIELISAQDLNDNGAVLVVDVHGEQLVLGVSGRRDYVTLLTKLGEPADVERLNPAQLSAMMTARMATPAAAVGVAPASPARAGMAATTSSLVPPPLGEEHSQDEDLEELLDELLGKVRGLKPLAKHSDET
ncbi:MAG: flagellar biosynthetic protein FliO [Myxococcota bacterium]